MRVDTNLHKKDAVFRILVSVFSVQIYVLSLLNANECNKEDFQEDEFACLWYIAKVRFLQSLSN